MATIVAAAGGGNWSSTATWTGGVVPTAADDAQLTAASGNVTIDTNVACRSLDCNGYTGTLTHNTATTLSIGTTTPGLSNIALRFVTGMTYTSAGNSANITFVSTSATQQTIEPAGKLINGTTFNGVGGSWLLTSGYLMGQGATFSVGAGTINFGTFTHTIGLFASIGTLARTITLNASTISMLGADWNMSTITPNLTFNAGTSTVQWITSTTVTPTINAPGQTFYNLLVTKSSGGINITSAPGSVTTFNNFTMDNTVIGGGNRALSLNGDLAINGILKYYGFSNVNAGFLVSTSLGFPRTITLAGSATVDFNSVDFRDIAIAGNGAPVGGTRLGDGGGTSGINFPSPVTYYWIGGGGQWNSATNWSLSSGGATANTTPLLHDYTILDANSFTTTGQVFTVSNIRVCSINALAALNQPVFRFTNPSGAGNNMYGNLILPEAGGSTDAVGAAGGASTLTFFNRTPAALRMSGIALGANLSLGINSFGSSLVLTSDLMLQTDRQISLNNGLFDMNGFNVTTGRFVSNNANIRAIQMKTGTMTLTGTGVVFSNENGSNYTFDAGTSTIIINDTSNSVKQIARHTGQALYNVVCAAGTAGGVQFTNANSGSFNDMTVSPAGLVIFNSPAQYFINGITTIPAGSTVKSNNAGVPATLTMNGNTQAIDPTVTWTDITKIFLYTGSATGLARTSNGTNLIGNPSFETDTSAWGSYGGNPICVISRDAANPFVGQYSLKVITSAAGDGQGFVGGAQVNTIASLIVGNPYVFSVWLWSPIDQISPTTNLYISSGSTNANMEFTISKGWNRLSIPFIARAGGAICYIRIRGALNTIYYIDAAQVEDGYSPTPYSETTLNGPTAIYKGMARSLRGGLAGIVHNGFMFTGSKNDIFFSPPQTVGVAGPYDATTAVTVAARVLLYPNPNQSPSGNASGVIINHRYGNAAANFRSYVMELSDTVNNRVNFAVNKADNSARVTAATTPLTLGQRYLIVGRYDGTNVSIWLDGVKIQETPMTGNIGWDTTSTQDLHIGQFDAGSAAPLRALLKDAVVWKDYALTDAEIGTLSSKLSTRSISQMPGNSNIVVWLPMDESNAQTAVNYATGGLTPNVQAGILAVQGGFSKNMWRTLAVTAVSLAKIIRTMLKTLSISRTATTSLTRANIFRRTLAATANMVETITKGIGKMLAASRTASVSFNIFAARGALLIATAVSNANVTLGLNLYKKLIATVTAAPTLIPRQLRKITLSASISIAVMLYRIFSKVRSPVTLTQSDGYTVLNQED